MIEKTGFYDREDWPLFRWSRERLADRLAEVWAKLAKCSQDTALRDIDDLVRQGILIKNAAGGRSTSYSLVGGSE